MPTRRDVILSRFVHLVLLIEEFVSGRADFLARHPSVPDFQCRLPAPYVLFREVSMGGLVEHGYPGTPAVTAAGPNSSAA